MVSCLTDALRLGAGQRLHRMNGCLCRVAASFNNAINPDGLGQRASGALPKPAGYGERWASNGIRYAQIRLH